MPKTKISEYSTTNSANTDIESINIDEGCAPSGINNAIRELMVHLKEFQTGASGDAFTFAGGVLISGATNTISGNVLMSGTNTITGAVTVSGNINSSGTNTFSGTNILSGTNTVSGAVTASGNINSSGTNTFSGSQIISGGITSSGTNSFSGTNTFNSGSLKLAGSTSGTSTLNPQAVAGTTTYTLPNATSTLGFLNIPAVGTKTTSYTLATGDVGKYVQVGSSGSITIPDATFAEGDVISIFNNTSGTITITCSITTAYIAGTDSDKATMTLASRGLATIVFISSTVCVVQGNVS